MTKGDQCDDRGVGEVIRGSFVSDGGVRNILSKM